MNDQNAMPTIPAILEGEMEAAMLEQYFADLDAAADVMHIQVRSSAQTGGDRAVSLEELRRLVIANDVRMAQVRYAHNGSTWCDTLIVRPESIRLIRMLQDGSATMT